jgi:hypothetical protein
MGIPLRKDLQIEIPELGKLDVPYAYKNGQLNFVRPEGFPVDEQAATTKASELAVKGHLILRDPDQETGLDRQLIVVGGFDPKASEALRRKVEFLLGEHDGRLVQEDRIDEFVDEVRRDAHS